MRQRLIIIAIAVAALVVPAVIASLVIQRSPALQNSVLKLANVNTNANTANVEVNVNVAANTNTQAAADQASLTFVSRNFAEVYGSGSNQNNFSNIVEAQKYATKSFTDFLNRDITRQRQNQETTPYHEIVTTALVITITKQSATTAAVTVGTQRQETLDKQVTVYYQDILIDLLKVGADWKVNAATWKPR